MKTVTVLSTDKGFTLLEMLLSLMIISGIGLITLSFNPTMNLDHYYYMNDYLETLNDCFVEKKADVYEGGIYINSDGHVRQAKTINFGRHEVVIHLGNGYASIR